MKVLLIHPFRNDIGALESDEFMPSLAVLCLAASLRESGHQPIILDLAVKSTLEQEDPGQYCLDKIVDVLKKEKPPLVAISFLFSGTFPVALQYAKLIKKTLPDCKIITGGIHATSFPKEILSNCHEFDFIGISEGETTIVEIANRVENKNYNNLEEIRGFAFRDEKGEVHVNTNRLLENFEGLPMPAWDMIDLTEYEKPRPEFFSPKGFEVKNIIPIISTRGCPYKCTFCDLHLIQGRKMRRRGPLKFVDELEYLHKERGMNYFAFQDDNLVRDRRHIIAVCEEIVKRKINIQFETASGLHINSLTEEVIEHMVRAGMVYAAISVEHGNTYMRNEVMQKLTDEETIYRAVEMIRKYKVLIRGNWIMGYPEETNETLQDTYDMIEGLKIDRAAVLKLIPYPGTPVFNQCVKEDLFVNKVDIDNIWLRPVQPHQNEFVIKPYRMSLDELEEWRGKFSLLRNKYFGYFHRDLSPPRGFVRNEEGIVIPGGVLRPENSNKDVSKFAFDNVF